MKRAISLASVALIMSNGTALANCDGELRTAAHMSVKHMQEAVLCEPLVGDAHILISRLRIETIMLMAGESSAAASGMSDRAEKDAQKKSQGRDVTQLAGDPMLACRNMLDDTMRKSDIAFSQYEVCQRK